MHTALKCAVTAHSHRHRSVAERLRGLLAPPALRNMSSTKLAATFTPEVVRRRRVRSLWKFAEVLPVDRPRGGRLDGRRADAVCCPVRGCGPLADFRRLFVKDESFNPTGSFKARGMAAAITRGQGVRRTTVAMPSAGNAGGAAAAYAARAGMQCFVFMPEDTPASNLVEAIVAGAHVVLVNGLINDCGKLFARRATVRLVRPVHAQGAVSRRGQEDDGLRAGLRSAPTRRPAD